MAINHATATATTHFGRFRDEWLEDKMLTAFLMGSGGCDCCAASAIAQTIPNLMAQCTDIDTDDVKMNRNQAANWPDQLSQSIWQDRVVLRRKLKNQNREIVSFWNQYKNSFSQWWSVVCSDKDRATLMQLAVRPNIHAILRSADLALTQDGWSCLWLNILEQIQQFASTGYAEDAPPDLAPTEWLFEVSLQCFDGVFTMRDRYTQPPQCFLQSIASLGSIKSLLPKAKRQKSEVGREGSMDIDDSVGDEKDRREKDHLDSDGESSEEDKEDDKAHSVEEGTSSTNDSKMMGVLSYRSDRRLIRILLFQSMLHQIMTQFKEFLQKEARSSANDATMRASVPMKIKYQR